MKSQDISSKKKQMLGEGTLKNWMIATLLKGVFFL